MGKAVVALAAISMATAPMAPVAWADEGGTSFWLPGQFGSFAALPSAPGWSLPMMYYHASANQSANKTTQRGGRITAGLDAKVDMLFLLPTYVFEKPFLGGQASLGVGGALMSMDAGIDATLTGPRGGTLSGSESDSVTAGSDLYTQGIVKWNKGVHNYMAYTMLGTPIGAYKEERLINPGTNHWSLDGGGGYTYFDKKNEFSAVLGFTYNFENDDTDYQNGVDAHLDWGASRFISESTHVGLVGYFYQQVSGDSGSGARLGDYKSSVTAIGPQIGHFFAVDKAKWYVNLKGYYEFDAENRPEGWNLWVSLLIPLGSQ
ncbi:hypothetical protein GCM10011430_00190 [Oxalicibacterium solurbis]|uniref:Phenol degradation protein n=2 Tax=Oxalicibacterium solurbis TaxID=69280 RepID=A0A8J3B122_9BURK|nr:hypothetical protein GCM10011430_00190 [Oxalicibacterium solurbis]